MLLVHVGHCSKHLLEDLLGYRLWHAPASIDDIQELTIRSKLCRHEVTLVHLAVLVPLDFNAVVNDSDNVGVIKRAHSHDLIDELPVQATKVFMCTVKDFYGAQAWLGTT